MLRVARISSPQIITLPRSAYLRWGWRLWRRWGHRRRRRFEGTRPRERSVDASAIRIRRWIWGVSAGLLLVFGLDAGWGFTPAPAMTTIHWSVAASARLRQATRLIDKTQQAIAEQHWGWLRRHALRGRYPVVLPTVGLEGAYQQTHTWRVWPAGPLDVVVQSHHQPLLLQQPVEYANGTIHRWILWWTNGQWQIGV